MSLQQLINWLKQRALWLWKGKYYLLSFAAFSIMALYLTKFIRFHPSAVATIMMLTGLSIILRQQILEAKKYNSNKPNTFMGWLKSYPTNKTLSLSIYDVVNVGLVGKGHVIDSISDDATIEKKVDFILKQVAVLNSAIERVDNRVDEVNSSFKKTVMEFQTSVSALTTTFNNVIASHVVGSYDVSQFAINITICGTVIQFFCS